MTMSYQPERPDDLSRRSRVRTRTTVAASFVAVVLVVGAVAVAAQVSAGRSASTAGQVANPSVATSPSTQPAVAPIGDPASSDSLGRSDLVLFPGEEYADIHRSIDTDLNASWAITECATPLPPESARLDFIGGSEQGSEYVNHAQIAIFADEHTAAASANALATAIQACGADAGATIQTNEVVVGDHATVVSLSTEVSGGTEFSVYVVTADGRAVTLTGGEAMFFADAPPTDASSPAVTEAKRLLGELCRVGYVTCTG